MRQHEYCGAYRVEIDRVNVVRVIRIIRAKRVLILAAHLLDGDRRRAMVMGGVAWVDDAGGLRTSQAHLAQKNSLRRSSIHSSWLASACVCECV